jgi:hypothetical protein
MNKKKQIITAFQMWEHTGQLHQNCKTTTPEGPALV